MQPVSRVIIFTFLIGSVFHVTGRSLELRGKVEPRPSRARISIESAASAYTATTLLDGKGHFRFRKLPPGPYVLMVFQPGAGIIRHSVDVTPSLADANGRVQTTIELSSSTLTPLRHIRRNTVSVAELAIPARARREFDEAQKLERKQDMAGAIKRLNKAIELAPKFWGAWNELGTIAYRSRDWEQAETCFRKTIELRPGAVTAIMNLGGVLLYQGKYREALPYNRFSVERLGTSPLANFQLGMTFFMLGKDDEGLKYLKIAKGLDPSHYSSPQLALADVYLRRGESTAALSELEEFLSRHPDAPNAPTIRGVVARLKK